MLLETRNCVDKREIELSQERIILFERDAERHVFLSKHRGREREVIVSSNCLRELECRREDRVDAFVGEHSDRAVERGRLNEGHAKGGEPVRCDA